MKKREAFDEVDSLVVFVINKWLDRHSEYSLSEVAMGAGAKKSSSSFMTQIRAGRTKFPVKMVQPLATFLNEDPTELLMAVKYEYYPEMFEAEVESGVVTDHAIKALEDIKRSWKRALNAASA